MIHVAVDANALAWGWGGIPRYIERIVRLLAERDDMRLTLLANTSDPRIRLPGTTEVICRRRGGVVWRNAFVTDWLARRRPDVFWAPETLLPWRVPVPSVVTIHDLAALLFPGAKPLRVRVSYRTSIPHGVRRATRVMSVSNATAADAERLWGLAPDRVRVVAPGVDPVFGPADRVAARERVARDLGVRAPFVLAVGSLEPRKGLDVLIEAAALARARGDGWQLVLAGRAGHGGHGLVVRATAAGALVTGGVDEASLLNLYRAADVVAVPSLYEGFGLTPLEAMACGTPAVIAGGSGGLEEVSGAAAVVVARREAEAWRDALARARADRERLAEAGVAHAAQFTWTRAADRTADVLLEAAAA